MHDQMHHPVGFIKHGIDQLTTRSRNQRHADRTR